ncbi:MAG: hypothetical protein EXQ81_04770 [Thermoleophilia bacterium]|nr:hypothetical protein [Thermoleophilia bacterium]
MAGIGAVAAVCLVATLLVRRPEPIVGVLALLGATYALILVIDSPPLDGRSVIVGAALLTIGELAYLSVEAHLAVTEEAGATARRVASVAVLALLALALGATTLAVVGVLHAGGIATEVVGVAAAAAAVGLLVLAARDARPSKQLDEAGQGVTEGERTGANERGAGRSVV